MGIMSYDQGVHDMAFSRKCINGASLYLVWTRKYLLTAVFSAWQSPGAALPAFSIPDHSFEILKVEVGRML
jgi:hypothetical protein